MPIPLIAAALPAIIGAGSNLIGQGLNGLLTSGANRSSQNFQKNMYDRQRADALADWNRQNEYNSPIAQMTRYKEAGLNPNLIYGQSNTASPVQQASTGHYKEEAPQFDLGSVIGQFMDIMMADKKMDLMEKDITLRENQANNAYMQYSNIVAQNDKLTQEIALLRQKHGYLDAMNPLYKDNLTLKNQGMTQENEAFPQLLELKKKLMDSNLKTAVLDRLYKEQAILESKSRVEVNEFKKDLILEQIQQIKAGIALVKSRKSLIDKDVEWYEVKNGVNVVGKAINAVKGVIGGSKPGTGAPKQPPFPKWTKPYKYKSDTKDQRTWTPD